MNSFVFAIVLLLVTVQVAHAQQSLPTRVAWARDTPSGKVSVIETGPNRNDSTFSVEVLRGAPPARTVRLRGLVGKLHGAWLWDNRRLVVMANDMAAIVDVPVRASPIAFGSIAPLSLPTHDTWRTRARTRSGALTHSRC
jgi:hypothetical protein